MYSVESLASQAVSKEERKMREGEYGTFHVSFSGALASSPASSARVLVHAALPQQVCTSTATYALHGVFA